MKRIMRYAIGIVTVLFLVQFVSCSLFDKRPKLAEEALIKQIAEESAGYIKLLDFNKIDGKGIDDEYVLTFGGHIQYQKDCFKCSGTFTDFLYSDFNVWKSEPKGWDAFNVGVVKPIKKGLTVGIMGKAHFQKRENGWTVYKLEINETKDGGVEALRDGDGAPNEETEQKATANDKAAAPAATGNQGTGQDMPAIDASQLDPNESGDGEEPNMGPNADCNVLGVVKSLSFQGNNYLEIVISEDGKTSKVWCAKGHTQVFKGDNEIAWNELREGMKLCAGGKFETQEGQQQLNAQIISVVQ